jgi:predicted permease
MQQVIGLAAPFFGLILIGYIAAKVRKLPMEGLAWLNFLVVYVSLPALFYQLLSKTPIQELANGWFVTATTLATLTAFLLSLAIGLRSVRGNLSEAAIVAVCGGYSNVGYMGPGLALAALGTAAAVPVALILCFDSALMFILVPMLMAVAGSERKSFVRTGAEIIARIFLHPFILGTLAGIAASATGFHAPDFIDKLLTYLMNLSMPCALFALGVTVALRPIVKTPKEMPAVLLIKLIGHPLLVLVLLTAIGGMDPTWIATAVLIASLPPALSAFILAQQYQVYEDRASTTILIGTALSMATVTGVLYLVTHGQLPVTLFGR